MTRKDYVLIADAIKWQMENSTSAEQQQGVKFTAGELAWRLAQENPRFDRERFLTACGVK